VLTVLSCATWAADSSQTVFASGKAKFADRCSACHGAEGIGIEGLAPPLKNPELWKSLDTNGAKYIAGVMTGGMAGTINVDGVDYRGLIMPPQSFIESAELAEIAKYVVEYLNAAKSTPSVGLIDELKAAPLSHANLRAIRKGAQ